MALELDSLDTRLLALLNNNARESAANLARKLGTARTTVVARIARLERNGVVAGYGVRLARRWEDPPIQVFCGLKVNPKATSAVLRALERMHEVQEVCAVSGHYDYIVVLRCQSTEKLDFLLDQLGQIDGIVETHTSVVLSKKLDRRKDVARHSEAHLRPDGS